MQKWKFKKYFEGWWEKFKNKDWFLRLKCWVNIPLHATKCTQRGNCLRNHAVCKQYTYLETENLVSIFQVISHYHDSAEPHCKIRDKTLMLNHIKWWQWPAQATPPSKVPCTELELMVSLRGWRISPLLLSQFPDNVHLLSRSFVFCFFNSFTKL